MEPTNDSDFSMLKLYFIELESGTGVTVSALLFVFDDWVVSNGFMNEDFLALQVWALSKRCKFLLNQHNENAQTNVNNPPAIAKSICETTKLPEHLPSSSSLYIPPSSYEWQRRQPFHPEKWLQLILTAVLPYWIAHHATHIMAPQYRETSHIPSPLLHLWVIRVNLSHN